IAERPDQRRRLEKYDAAEIARDDENGGADPPFHCRDGRTRRAAGRNLFRGGESKGRAWLLHQQSGRRCSASVKNSRTVIRELEHPARVAPGLYGERRSGGARKSGLCHGRMRQMMRMTKSECLMTKETRITNDNNLAEGKSPSFALRHYFVIRHSCFVIYKLLLVLLFAVLIFSCVGRRITKANVD